jgi:hypothetical protein
VPVESGALRTPKISGRRMDLQRNIAGRAREATERQLGGQFFAEIPGNVGKKQGSAAIGLVKIHIVEKIEKLAPELQVCTLCQASILDQRKIEVDVLGTRF